ncbi:hypothetical protein [Achromobacter sp. UMC46]|uniref:hypothetical protein n=1 Tax=Achromobacter sp. UMC46 TaxID=1862319 RepID=UPI00160141C8|nr:hypothetical protein [Achromobacter sp. UMC46]
MELLYIALVAGAVWIGWKAGVQHGMTEAHGSARQQLDRDHRALYEAFVFDKALTLNSQRYVNYGRTDATTPPLVLIRATDFIGKQAQDLADFDEPDGPPDKVESAYERRWDGLVEQWLGEHQGLSESERQRLRQHLLA